MKFNWHFPSPLVRVSGGMKVMGAYNWSAEGLKKKRARMKALHADPEFKANAAARMKALNADPEFKARMKALNADPEFKANAAARMKALHADPEFKARMKALHADPEFKANAAAQPLVRKDSHGRICSRPDPTGDFFFDQYAAAHGIEAARSAFGLWEDDPYA